MADLEVREKIKTVDAAFTWPHPSDKGMFTSAVFVRTDDNKPYLIYCPRTSAAISIDEETYYPERAINAGKAVYVERNCEMIDKSEYCIVYYKDEYLPPRRKKSRRDLFDYQPKSGTGIAYQYAVKKNKTVINVAEKM